MSRSAASQRIGYALAASVLFHAALVWYLRAPKPRPAPFSAPRTIELEIVEAPTLPQPMAAPTSPAAPRSPKRSAAPQAPAAPAPLTDAPTVEAVPEASAPRRPAGGLNLLPSTAPSDLAVRQEEPPAA